MCRGHIAGHHFEEYKLRCDAVIPKVQLNFWCIPEHVKRSKGKGKADQTVLGFPKVVNKVTDFSQQGIVEAVAKHIACDDQVGFSV
jgi:hypothetical protein